MKQILYKFCFKHLFLLIYVSSMTMPHLLTTLFSTLNALNDVPTRFLKVAMTAAHVSWGICRIPFIMAFLS